MAAAKKKAAKKEVEEEAKKTHIVTQEDLDANPSLVEEGVEVGDEIELPEDEEIEAPAEQEEAPKAKKTKGGEATAIIKGEDEYIRTYPAGADESVASFLSKDPAYKAVPASSIVQINVTTKAGVKVFDEKTNGTGFKEEAVVFKNQNQGACVAIFG